MMMASAFTSWPCSRTKRYPFPSLTARATHHDIRCFHRFRKPVDEGNKPPLVGQKQAFLGDLRQPFDIACPFLAGQHAEDQAAVLLLQLEKLRKRCFDAQAFGVSGINAGQKRLGDMF
jgi:hypothetical protein